MKKKSIGLLVSLVLLLTVSVGATLAFLIDQTDSLPNTFTPSEVTVQVNETFDGDEKKDVSIKNTGDTEAYIRAAIVVTWQKIDGANVYVYGKEPVKDTDYTLTLNMNSWIKGSNGYYYYTSPVAPGANTGILITSATEKDTAPDGYDLCIEILASGIQSEYDGTGDHPAEQAWGVTVENGTITAVNNG